MFEYTLQTPTTRRHASYRLNVVSEAKVGVRGWGIIIVTLLWSEIVGGYITQDTTVEKGA